MLDLDRVFGRVKDIFFIPNEGGAVYQVVDDFLARFASEDLEAFRTKHLLSSLACFPSALWPVGKLLVKAGYSHVPESVGHSGLVEEVDLLSVLSLIKLRRSLRAQVVFLGDSTNSAFSSDHSLNSSLFRSACLKLMVVAVSYTHLRAHET